MALSCRDLTYAFGSHRAVDQVDLEVRAGEIFGLLGPNGAGKTTTIRLVTTLLPVQEGRVSVFGLDVSEDAIAVRRMLGYVPQQLSADGGLTGRQNVALFTRLFDVPRRRRHEVVEEVLEMMQLTDAADRLVATYSGGMVRRLELAQALVNRPALLILDEPTIGLDPVARDSVWQHVRALREETGMTVVLTTHYMQEADELCDHVALMHHGVVRVTGTPEQLKNQVGPDATLDDVFRTHTGSDLDEAEGGLRDVRRTRRTATRLG